MAVCHGASRLVVVVVLNQKIEDKKESLINEENERKKNLSLFFVVYWHGGLRHCRCHLRI